MRKPARRTFLGLLGFRTYGAQKNMLRWLVYLAAAPMLVMLVLLDVLAEWFGDADYADEREE